MPQKLTILTSLQLWITAGAGGAFGWLLIHLLATNWSNLKALFI